MYFSMRPAAPRAPPALLRDPTSRPPWRPPATQPLGVSGLPRRPRPVSCRAGTSSSRREKDAEPRAAAAPTVRRLPAAALGNIHPLEKPPALAVAVPRRPVPEEHQELQSAPENGPQDAAAGPPPGPLAAAWPSVCGLHAVPLPQQSPALARITARGEAGAFPPPAPPPPPGPHVIPIPGLELTEIMAGRVALAGLVGVEAMRAVTGMDFPPQAAAFGDNAGLLAAIVVGGSLVATALPRGRGVEVRIVPLLSLRAEKAVGRLAMLGWAAELAAAAAAALW